MDRVSIIRIRADFQREDVREKLDFARRIVYAVAIPLG
jgi:hypothetical protein